MITILAVLTHFRQKNAVLLENNVMGISCTYRYCVKIDIFCVKIFTKS
jgi:hypothetical protein